MTRIKLNRKNSSKALQLAYDAGYEAGVSAKTFDRVCDLQRRNMLLSNDLVYAQSQLAVMRRHQSFKKGKW